MKKIMLLCCVALIMGCKGKTGSQGPKGEPGHIGLPGPGSFAFITGNVISDDFVVTDSRIAKAEQIAVYLGDGVNNLQLPYFLPGYGVNTFYAFRNNQVEIVNAQKAMATKYVIEIIMQ